MKVCIVGIGSMGLFVAALLSRRAEVSLIPRISGEDRATTIEVTGASAFKSVALEQAPIESEQARGLLGEADLVLVCVKAHQLSSLTALFAAITSQKIVLIQNGLGILDAARAAGLPATVAVARMLCSFGVVREKPYTVRFSGGDRAILAPKEPWVEKFAEELLIPNGILTSTVPSVLEAEWRKVLVNVFVNPLCTIVDRPNSAVLDIPTLRELGLAMFDEALQVAAADGCSITDLTHDRLLHIVRPFAANINSHLVDLRAGRASDMSFVLGEVERRAQKHGISVPKLQAVYQVYRAIERARGIE